MTKLSHANLILTPKVKKKITDSGWEERSNENLKLKGEIKRNCIKLNNTAGHIE